VKGGASLSMREARSPRIPLLLNASQEHP